MRQLVGGALGVVLLASTALACRSTSDGPEPRIRPRWLVADDGARERIGFWDSERKEGCAFGLMADGKIRCLPTAVSFQRAWADAECSKQPVAVLSSSNCPVPPPRYAALLKECAYTQHLYEVVGSKESLPGYYFGESGGPLSCSYVGSPVDVVAVGDPIPDDAFAEATTMTVGTDRIVSIEHVTADGTREWLGWYDTELGVSCNFTKVDATTSACVPVSAPSRLGAPEYSSVYVGTACRDAVAHDVVAARCADDPPDPPPPCGSGAPTVREWMPVDQGYLVEGTCPDFPLVRRIGPVASGAYSVMKYFAKGGTCVAVKACSLGPDVGDELVLRPSLQSGDVRLTRDGTRLRAYIEGQRDCSDEQTPKRARFRDQVLQFDCQFATAVDGVTRCLPTTAFEIGGFADDSCTAPILSSDRTKAVEPFLIRDTDNIDKCARALSAYRTAWLDGVSSFHLVDGACVPTGAPPGGAWVATPMSPAEFVGAKEVIE